MGSRLARNLRAPPKGHYLGCAPRGALSVSSLMRFKHEIYHSDFAYFMRRLCALPRAGSLQRVATAV